MGMPLAVVGVVIALLVLLALALLLTAMTVAAGQAMILQGAVHLVLFAVFLFLAMVP